MLYEGKPHYITLKGMHYLAASWFVFDITLFFPIGIDFNEIKFFTWPELNLF